MGACLSKSHKELQSAHQPPVTELQFSVEGQSIAKVCCLVATIKEHITKPTAMAQGRVAHLIEWKGWSAGGGGAGGAGYTWGGTGGGWRGAGAELQVDEQLYSHLTDEIKEARFAAGVAEQFALAEAAMCAWSSQDIPADTNCSVAPLQAFAGSQKLSAPCRSGGLCALTVLLGMQTAAHSLKM
ncbi:hypothetical protein JZ751_014848, partial [Albula glossodonta]